ncbi:MAG: 30S ribosomal protein S16 [Chloroflexi bacterium]|nr:30S ribosomal protein S16 [Chloroflexota bacterium]
MVRIRLRRMGAKRQPSYRLVVADRESPRDGRFLEIIGQYNPRTEPATVVVDEARALHWLKNGARPSQPAERLLKTVGTLDRFARLKSGEALETLIAEAQAATAGQPVSPKTRRDEKTGVASKGKSKKKKAAEAAETAQAA